MLTRLSGAEHGLDDQTANSRSRPMLCSPGSSAQSVARAEEGGARAVALGCILRASPASVSREISPCPKLRIGLEDNRPYAWRFRDGERRYELPVSASVSVNDGEGLAALAAAGMAQVPVYIAQPSSTRGSLRPCSTPFKMTARRSISVFAPGPQHIANVRAIAEQLVRVAARALT